MESQPTQSQAVNLDYASAPSKRRRWLRRGILLVLVLGCTLAGWRWGPYAWRQGRILYWQHQCMIYTAGPDVVAYEEEPQAAAKLLASGSGYVACPFSRETAENSRVYLDITAAGQAPTCWQEFLETGGGRITEYRLSHGCRETSPLCVVFLHERTSDCIHALLLAGDP
jgi:hypothetical protein